MKKGTKLTNHVFENKYSLKKRNRHRVLFHVLEIFPENWCCVKETPALLRTREVKAMSYIGCRARRRLLSFVMRYSNNKKMKRSGIMIYLIPLSIAWDLSKHRINHIYFQKRYKEGAYD